MTLSLFRTILVLNMLIKKETEYAVLALIALSEKKGEFVDAKVIAREENISETLLAKIFQKLAAADIVASKQGPNGGFQLLKDTREVTLWQIFSAVQTPNIIKCYDGAAPYCKKPVCALKNTVAKMESFLEDFLSNTTLHELIIKS